MAIGAKEFQEISQRVEALEKLTKELSGRLWEAERQLACLNEVEQAHSESERPSGDEENEMNETSEQPSGLSPAERARRTANRVKAKARKTVDAEKLDEWYAAVDQAIKLRSERGETDLAVNYSDPHWDRGMRLPSKLVQSGAISPSYLPVLISMDQSEVLEEIKNHYSKQGYKVLDGGVNSLIHSRVMKISWK